MSLVARTVLRTILRNDEFAVVESQSGSQAELWLAQQGLGGLRGVDSLWIKQWEERERERAVKSRCCAAEEARFFFAEKDVNHSCSGKGITQVLKASQEALEATNAIASIGRPEDQRSASVNKTSVNNGYESVCHIASCAFGRKDALNVE